MTAEQFAYWMQGFAELTGDEPPTVAQWKSMREHLAAVFVKATPPVGVPTMPGLIPPPYTPQHPHTGSPLPLRAWVSC